MDLLTIEKQLNDKDIRNRRKAVLAFRQLIKTGEWETPVPRETCNLHSHTFFSYNAYEHSPSSLAWLARREGIRIMGIVDFDTLEGADEFLWACDQLDVRGTVSLETMVYLPEFADRIITSKGQPGVAYYLLSGFTTGALSPQAQQPFFELRKFMRDRNLRIVKSLNEYLFPLTVDYFTDVVGRSAGETPTERHIMESYFDSGENLLEDPLFFWSEKLGLDVSNIQQQYQHSFNFRQLMRDKLIKAGGIAYQSPDATHYPPLELVNNLANLTGTLPTLVWANGTSEGEQDEETFLSYLVQKDLVGLNIIPDRNINSPESERDLRIKCLYEIVALAADLDLPIFIGTEMNMPGHKWADDLDVPTLAPVKQTFMDGACLLYGHTMLERYAGLGYRSGWSKDQFNDRRSRNLFYTRAGTIVPNDVEGRTFLQKIPQDLSGRELHNLLERKFPRP